MESNERDQIFDDNQRGQNTQPQWQTAENNVQREWKPDTEVFEHGQRTNPSSDENEDDAADNGRTDHDQRQNYQTPAMDYVEDDVRRETDTENFGQGRRPISDENDEDSENYDRTDRDQRQNLRTPQSSHTNDEHENSSDEIRTDFAGDGFRRELNTDDNVQGKQPSLNENRDDTEENYRADRDQRQDFQTPLTDHPEYDRPSNPLSDQNTDEGNEEIPRRTDNPNELPDRDQNRGFRVPVSDDEETV